MKKYKLIFGVFDKGKLVFQIGQTIKCDLNTAEIIVGILDMAHSALMPGHYFACDFAKE